MRSGTPFSTEWNALVDYVTSLRIAKSDGVTVKHTSHGTALSPVEKPRATPLRKVYVRCCLSDGTEAFLPVVIAGNPVRSNGGTTNAITILEVDVPDNSEVLE
jgi:hypothetical protein